MRVVLLLVLLISGPVFGASLRGNVNPKAAISNAPLNPSFEQMKKQTPTDTTAQTPAATDTPAASDTSAQTPAATDTTAQTPAATDTTAQTPAATDTSAQTPAATDTSAQTPAATDTTAQTPAATDAAAQDAAATDASAATGEGTGTSNADLEAEQAKLNTIKDQIVQEQQKLDAIHAGTLVTDPEMSGSKQYTDDMTNEQVDAITKQVLTIPDLQKADDQTLQDTCAAKKGAAGAGATGATGAPAAAGATGEAEGTAEGTAAGGGGGGGGASDAEIMKKHKEFATLIKHAQQSIDDVATMPYLGQNSDAEAAALTCGAPAADSAAPAATPAAAAPAAAATPAAAAAPAPAAVTPAPAA